MKILPAYLFLAMLIPIMTGCGGSSGPTSPAVRVDSTSGFVPLAVGNAWTYSLNSNWFNGHDFYRTIDSGSRRITIASRADSAGMIVYHARIEDSILKRSSFDGLPGDPVLDLVNRTISILEDSSRLRLPPGTADEDGMLAACFRSHAFPADSVHKVPGNAYGTPGLPDSILVAAETREVLFLRYATSAQAQAIGLLAFTVAGDGIGQPNGSVSSGGKLEYRLVDIRHSP